MMSKQDVTAETLQAEDDAAQADVAADMALIEGAKTLDDAKRILAIIEKTYDGCEDPRLTAAVTALKRILGRK